MLPNWNQLGRLTIHATDGDLGRIETIYFDDERWAVRYFVVDTGGWLSGRRVLISPISVREVNWTEGRLEVSLTQDEVRNSPDIDTERPVSRQQELRYYAYYGYPYYWGAGGLWSSAAYPGALVPPYHDPETRATMETTTKEAQELQAASDARNSHLRSAKVVKGYHIHATDGEIGHVEDFIVDDQSWSIRYLVVDTSNWLGGARVLIAPSWIREVSWGDSKVYVSMTKEAVKNSPKYEPAHALTRPYEERLYSHYGTAGYWSGNATLRRLDESIDFQVAENDPDVKDWDVVALDGRRIGTVEHLIIDPAAMKVRYLEVGVEKGLRGVPGTRDILIPVEYVDLNESTKTIHLPAVSSDMVGRLPAFTGLPIEAGYNEEFWSLVAAREHSVSRASGESGEQREQEPTRDPQRDRDAKRADGRK